MYGTLQFYVYVEVESNKEHMAMLEADMKMDKLDEGRLLNVVDPVTGEVVATLRVHNAEYKWESYFWRGRITLYMC